jgi:hypothetical protein
MALENQFVDPDVGQILPKTVLEKRPLLSKTRTWCGITVASLLSMGIFMNAQGAFDDYKGTKSGIHTYVGSKTAPGDRESPGIQYEVFENETGREVQFFANDRQMPADLLPGMGYDIEYNHTSFNPTKLGLPNPINIVPVNTAEQISYQQ